MRKPSEYIAAAIRNVRANLMPDSSATMVHGACTAKVTRVGSPSKGEDEVSGDSPAESVRVLALHSDFPEVERDEVVTLDGETHLVTSARTDPASASLKVGLSAPLKKHTAVWTGSRRNGRTIRATVELLAINNGKMTDYADGYAPIEVYSWTLVVPKAAWGEVDPPQVGDAAENDGMRLKVANVTDKGGYWMIAARSR